MPHPTKNQLPISRELAEILAPRIMQCVRKVRRANGCWIRYAYIHPNTGYTQIARQVDGKKTYYLAHRVMYVLAHGPIPDGFTVDHLCERPACCNPRHLKAVPHRENVLRGKNNPYAINARKSECDRGHDFVLKNGRRHCPICVSANRAAARLRRKAQGVPPEEAYAHGTRRGYQWWSCRCDECAEWAHLDYLRRKARRGTESGEAA